MFRIAKGKIINQGESRIVYDYPFDNKWVIKELKLFPRSHYRDYRKYMLDLNYLEFLTYKNFKFHRLDWLLSPCFYFKKHLLMKKVNSVHNFSETPMIFSDHVSNWGCLHGNLVCIDYDFMFFYNSNFLNPKERKLTSTFSGLYLFYDQEDYIKRMQKKFSINYLPFTYKVIRNKFHLKKILKHNRKMIS